MHIQLMETSGRVISLIAASLNCESQKSNASWDKIKQKKNIKIYGGGTPAHLSLLRLKMYITQKTLKNGFIKKSSNLKLQSV